MTATYSAAKMTQLPKVEETRKKRRVLAPDEEDDYMFDTDDYIVDDRDYYKIRLPDGRELGRRPQDRNSKATSGPLVVGPADSGELFSILIGWGDWRSNRETLLRIKNGESDFDGYNLLVVDGRLTWRDGPNADPTSGRNVYDYIYGQRDNDHRNYLCIETRDYGENYDQDTHYFRGLSVGEADSDPSYSFVNISQDSVSPPALSFEVQFVRTSEKAKQAAANNA